MNKTFLIIAAAGLAFFYLAKKKVASGSIKWMVTGLDLKNKSINIQLINPSNTPINFKAFVAEVLLNNSSLGILDYRNATILSGNGFKNITIPIKFNPLALLSLVGYIKNPEALKKATIMLDGTINAENITIPFKQQVNIA